MLGLPLAFTVPAVLGALILLPILFVLLRVTPPRPRTIPFPPLRLILDQQPRQETPARTPWWLLLLRLAIAAAVILAMAGPIWNPPAALTNGGGPVVLIVDDGVAAAPDWDKRIAATAERIRSAERDGRPVAIVAMSEGGRGIQITAGTPGLDRLRALKPQPVIPDRTLVLPALAGLAASHPAYDLIWVADGLENGKARAFAEALVELPGHHSVAVISGNDTPVAVAGAENRSDLLDIHLVRADNGAPAEGRLRAFDIKGQSLGDATFSFSGTHDAHAAITLPVELRNEIARVGIDGVASAAAVSLLDSRWQRRRVGLVSGTTAETAQPLLSPAFYVARALAPYADVRQSQGSTADPIAMLLDEQPSVMVLADLNVGTGTDHDRLRDFVANGGVLVRFAGARLAGAADDLVPVNLRKGGRNLGGALSWEQPKRLAPFEPKSPFFGLKPHDEITVSRQVLAEPDPGLVEKTWAQLVDGTPLVTAERRGKGTIVLFHVTADTTWSNLPLSGLFVDMMRRLVTLSSATAKESTPTGTEPVEAANLQPARTLDGFGVLGPPPSTAKPLAVGTQVATLEHPPGFYGPPDALVALNALPPDTTLSRACRSTGRGSTHPLPSTCVPPS